MAQPANSLTRLNGFGILAVMTRTITATAPARIDFGGGTLDIFPLYLFFDGGMTINAAIDLGAEVTLTARDDERVMLRSLDTGHALEVNGGVAALPLDGPLALLARVLRHFAPAGGLEVTTRLLPPHGSGLGASSTLFIALAHAVLAYQGAPRDPERIIRLCNGLEAQLMGMPAGMQDYYPPTYGGINAVHYDLEGVRVESLDPRGDWLDELQRHLLVCDTRITHHSGTTNWSKIRNFFDKAPRTVESLRRIKKTVLEFYGAFQARDPRQIGLLLRDEWENRKGLADAVTSAEIDRMIAATYTAGAWGSKLCGAGGGGCMLTFAPPDTHDAIRAGLAHLGARPLDVRLVREGVTVTAR